ncbi:hypothetical protein, partial [Xanthomonas oryzae]
RIGKRSPKRCWKASTLENPVINHGAHHGMAHGNRDGETPTRHRQDAQLRMHCMPRSLPLI